MARKRKPLTPIQKEWDRIRARVKYFNKKNGDNLKLHDIRMMAQGRGVDMENENEVVAFLKKIRSYTDIENIYRNIWGGYEEIFDELDIRLDYGMNPENNHWNESGPEFENLIDMISFTNPAVADLFRNTFNWIGNNYGFEYIDKAIEDANEYDGRKWGYTEGYDYEAAISYVRAIMEHMPEEIGKQAEDRIESLIINIRSEYEQETAKWEDFRREKRNARVRRYRERKRKGLV